MIGSMVDTITPHKIAIQTEKESVTYGELEQRIAALQHRLLHILGEDAPRRIALFLGNEPAFVEAFLAVALLGWAAVPMDPKWSRRELDHVLAECRPDLAVCSPNFSRSAPVHLPQLSIQTLQEQKLEMKVKNDKQAIFYIGYTSGSTGQPKGFMRHHLSWLESFRGAEKAFSLTHDDHIYAPGPLCHSLSLFAAVHAIHLGATLYINEAFSAATAASVLQDKPITAIYAVPTMLYALASEADSRNSRLRTILCSGAKWPARQKELVKEVFPHARLYEFYGASELSFVTYTDEAISRQKPDSVGIPFPYVEVFILRSDGSEAEIGEIGEVHVKSKLVFFGYVHGAETVFSGEYASVGDLGFRDADGCITLVGRKKNMIISGGLNVYPEEVEEVLRQHGAVEEAVVIGVQDDYWGEKLVAAVQWKETVNIQALKEHCRHELSSYKCPRLFVQLDSFPLTSSGKISRAAVAALIGQKLQKREEVMR